MSRSMVGLLAAVGAAMSALIALAHGDIALMIMAAVSGAATGSAAYLLSSSALEKNVSNITLSGHIMISGSD